MKRSALDFLKTRGKEVLQSQKESLARQAKKHISTIKTAVRGALHTVVPALALAGCTQISPVQSHIPVQKQAVATCSLDFKKEQDAGQWIAKPGVVLREGQPNQKLFEVDQLEVQIEKVFPVLQTEEVVQKVLEKVKTEFQTVSSNGSDLRTMLAPAYNEIQSLYPDTVLPCQDGNDGSYYLMLTEAFLKAHGKKLSLQHLKIQKEKGTTSSEEVLDMGTITHQGSIFLTEEQVELRGSFSKMLEEEIQKSIPETQDFLQRHTDFQQWMELPTQIEVEEIDRITQSDSATKEIVASIIAANQKEVGGIDYLTFYDFESRSPLLQQLFVRHELAHAFQKQIQPDPSLNVKHQVLENEEKREQVEELLAHVREVDYLMEKGTVTDRATWFALMTNNEITRLHQYTLAVTGIKEYARTYLQQTAMDLSEEDRSAKLATIGTAECDLVFLSDTYWQGFWQYLADIYLAQAVEVYGTKK